jgi:hypothetical protein
MTALGCGSVEVNPPQRSIKQHEKCGLAAASQPPMGYRGDLTAFMIEWRNRPHARENTAGKNYLSCGVACALV